MSGFGLILSILLIPTIRKEIGEGDEKEKPVTPTLTVLQRFNPWRVFKLLLRPNILLAVS
jgi:hypothetical protein